MSDSHYDLVLLSKNAVKFLTYNWPVIATTVVVIYRSYRAPWFAIVALSLMLDISFHVYTLAHDLGQGRLWMLPFTIASIILILDDFIRRSEIDTRRND